jgi:multicomponent Na+:H+ antiporter subunit F
MKPALAIEWATLAALVMLGGALLLTVVRIVVGPTLGDRVLALDMLTVVALGFVGTVCIRSGLFLYLDIAIALALLGFLATIAFARYMLSRLERKGADVL